MPKEKECAAIHGKHRVEGTERGSCDGLLEVEKRAIPP